MNGWSQTLSYPSKGLFLIIDKHKTDHPVPPYLPLYSCFREGVQKNITFLVILIKIFFLYSNLIPISTYKQKAAITGDFKLQVLRDNLAWAPALRTFGYTLFQWLSNTPRSPAEVQWMFKWKCLLCRFKSAIILPLESERKIWFG